MDKKEINFTAIDFETANSKQMICQVGIAVVRNGEIVEKISRLVRPPINSDFDRMNVRVHHITPEMTENESTFEELWPELEPYFTNQTLVAHNMMNSDKPILMKNLNYYGLMLMGNNRFIDTVNLFCGKRMKLDELCAGFGLPTKGHHDAGEDAEMCARIYLKYLAGETPNGKLINMYKVGNRGKHHKLTYEHYLNRHTTLPLFTIPNKEFFVGANLSSRADCFMQIIGNFGGFANYWLNQEIQICILSNSTIEKLKNGESDETIEKIQKFYDDNSFVVFDFYFVSEQDILDYCACWLRRYPDDTPTKTLYDLYMGNNVSPNPIEKMQAEIDALKHENERLRAESNKRDLCQNEQNKITIERPRPRRVRRQKVDVMKLYSSPAIKVEHKDDHSERNRKIIAAIATAVVFLILINTVGLFGIAALGLIAGGILK